MNTLTVKTAVLGLALALSSTAAIAACPPTSVVGTYVSFPAFRTDAVTIGGQTAGSFVRQQSFQIYLGPNNSGPFTTVSSGAILEIPATSGIQTMPSMGTWRCVGARRIQATVLDYYGLDQAKIPALPHVDNSLFQDLTRQTIQFDFNSNFSRAHVKIILVDTFKIGKVDADGNIIPNSTDNPTLQGNGTARILREMDVVKVNVLPGDFNKGCDGNGNPPCN